jgi:hypothetical protein
MKQVLIFSLMLLASCTFFDEKYHIVEGPVLAQYKRGTSDNENSESISLLNDSVYVRELSVNGILETDTARYTFLTRPKSSGLNRMGINFKNWRFIYDSISLMPITGDSVGEFRCHYVLEYGTHAKVVVLGDAPFLDYCAAP